jgi:hypothetical protein
MVGLRQSLWWIAHGVVSEGNKVVGGLVVLYSGRGVAHTL